MIRKAVIPAAGFGTRFLPATKSQPKEMLPIVDKPVIQYVVEEAVASGITDILMVIGKGKRSIEEHFDRNFELEKELELKGKERLLKQIRHISEMADIHFVWQRELKGLGDAVACAEHHVGNEPFVVLLGDTVLQSHQPVTKQLLKVYERYQEPVVALEEVDRAKVSRYGVIDGAAISDSVYLIKDLVEKPDPVHAPSNLVIASRYVLTPEIFKHLRTVPRGKNNEIQLTDAMRQLLKSCAMYGLKFDGCRHDIGDKMGIVKTNLLFALQHADMKDEITRFVKDLSRTL